MHRVGRGKAIDHLEAIAVEHADMVIAGLDHEEEIHRVGGEDRRFSGQVVRVCPRAGSDRGGSPGRNDRERRPQVLDERRDLRV